MSSPSPWITHCVDAFGNISKSVPGGSNGLSFLPGYYTTPATNPYVVNNPMSLTDPLGLILGPCEDGTFCGDDDGGGGSPVADDGSAWLFDNSGICYDCGPISDGFGGKGGGGVLLQAMQNAATALENQYCADVVDGGTGIAASTLASNFAATNGTSDPAETASFGTITSDNLTSSPAFYGQLNVGGATENTTEVITGSNHGTAGFLSSITMNSNALGFFMNPGLVSVMGTGTGTGYTNQAFQTIELLHELGHGSAFYGAPSAIVEDSGSASLSGQNTQTIENACFPQGDFGGNQDPITAPPSAVAAFEGPHRTHF